MQCKDIPDLPIVEFVAALDNKRWGTWFMPDDPVQHHHPDTFNSVYPLFGEVVPHKLMLAKMANLMKRGLIDGCPCGCRGDYEITKKGRAFVVEQIAAGAPRCPEPILARAEIAAAAAESMGKHLN